MKTTEQLLQEHRSLLQDFEANSMDGDVRARVRSLVPVHDSLREIGKSIVPEGLTLSARDRLLVYFRLYPRTILSERELSLVAGISEWARRIRELRVQFGWRIITGVTAGEMLNQDDIEAADADLSSLGPNDYMLLDESNDRDAAYRWNVANEIKRSNLSMRDKIIAYLRRNVGQVVTGEELRYVAQGTEWARRVRELRTEHGWPITTKASGNPSLPVGVYVLEEDRQTPVYDRRIPEHVRREALRRDQYRCKGCGWSHSDWNSSDPRFLEIHHVVYHSHGGTSEIDNLVTYCNVCHDRVHSTDREGQA